MEYLVVDVFVHYLFVDYFLLLVVMNEFVVLELALVEFVDFHFHFDCLYLNQILLEQNSVLVELVVD